MDDQVGVDGAERERAIAPAAAGAEQCDAKNLVRLNVVLALDVDPTSWAGREVRTRFDDVF